MWRAFFKPQTLKKPGLVQLDNVHAYDAVELSFLRWNEINWQVHILWGLAVNVKEAAAKKNMQMEYFCD